VPALWGWLGGEWRRGHTFDAWDASAGVWREVRELWAYGSGAWRAIYRRAFLGDTGVTELGGEPLTYSVAVQVSGIAPGTVSCVIRINGTPSGGGPVAVPSSQSFGVTGTVGPDTIEVQLVSPLGRLLDSRVVL
jgi:hypothetical protein